jgi:ABC-type transport system involved in multi-copper enzyme maturation permease subunit
MVFGLGPVVRYELITTARRGRYYLGRTVYGSVLLFLLWQQFGAWEAGHPRGGTPEDLRRFAESTFIVFARAQLAAMLFLLPALVAGVIADEHQRKTLHYLLASRLSSPEIVLGKLGARLVHVGTFVALGLPVVSLLALYGGLDPLNVLHVYVGTATTVLAVAGLSIFLSVLARRPRDAILAAYALEAVWLLGPPVVNSFARYLEGPMSWVWPVNSLLLVTNPLYFLDIMTMGFGFAYWPGWEYFDDWFAIRGPTPFELMFATMAVLQALAGLMFLGLAIAGLRPLRGSSWPGGEPRAGWWARLRGRVQALGRHRAAAAVARNELLASRIRRPACGDRPMLWKERYTTVGGGLRWLGSRPVVLFCGVLLGCYLFDVAYPVVVASLGHRGTFRLGEVGPAVRDTTAALSVLGLLAVAASSGVALTGEREQDTWISLATTLLTPGEVVRAKQFGAVWSARRVGLAVLITWGVGLLQGAVHPLAVAIGAGVIAVAAWFTAAVGVCASAFARNSTRALAATFIALPLPLSYWPLSFWGALFTPYQPGIGTPEVSKQVAWPHALTPADLAGLIVLTAGYAAIAGALTAFSIRRLRATWGRA